MQNKNWADTQEDDEFDPLELEAPPLRISRGAGLCFKNSI